MPRIRVGESSVSSEPEIEKDDTEGNMPYRKDATDSMQSESVRTDVGTTK